MNRVSSKSIQSIQSIILNISVVFSSSLPTIAPPSSPAPLPSDDSSEEDVYSDDDDISWKVRRAAAKTLQSLVLARQDLLSQFYESLSVVLIQSFKGFLFTLLCLYFTILSLWLPFADSTSYLLIQISLQLNSTQLNSTQLSLFYFWSFSFLPTVQSISNLTIYLFKTLSFLNFPNLNNDNSV